MVYMHTFISAGVLITSVRGQNPALQQRALAVLNDPQREFASSEFVKLEVLPKAVWVRNQAELAFYERFFNGVSHWPDNNDDVIARAHFEAAAYGLGTVDALHIAAAALLGVAELVTIETPTKSIHRTRSIRVVTLR